MPEMPEVEAVCRKLRDVVVGLRIEGIQVFRCATDAVAEAAAGRDIQAVERRGKHILLRLSGGVTLHTHLRMSGNLFAIPDWRFHLAEARVLIQLRGGSGIVLEDGRALARMDAAADEKINKRMNEELGPEPLGADFTVTRFQAMAKLSRQPAKLFLMDQSNVAGLGNIYAAEVLFRAGVHPRKPVNRLSMPRVARLHGSIVRVLEDALKSAVAAYSGPGSFHSEETFEMRVYDREGEPCTICERRIRRIPQGGRSTYYCPGCQR